MLIYNHCETAGLIRCNVMQVFFSMGILNTCLLSSIESIQQLVARSPTRPNRFYGTNCGMWFSKSKGRPNFQERGVFSSHINSKAINLLVISKLQAFLDDDSPFLTSNRYVWPQIWRRITLSRFSHKEDGNLFIFFSFSSKTTLALEINPASRETLQIKIKQIQIYIKEHSSLNNWKSRTSFNRSHKVLLKHTSNLQHSALLIKFHTLKLYIQS